MITKKNENKLPIVVISCYTALIPIKQHIKESDMNLVKTVLTSTNEVIDIVYSHGMYQAVNNLGRVISTRNTLNELEELLIKQPDNQSALVKSVTMLPNLPETIIINVIPEHSVNALAFVNTKVERIIQDSENTLVSFLQGEKHLGFFKIGGLHSEKDYLLFTFKHCQGLWTECNDMEKHAFIDWEEI